MTSGLRSKTVTYLTEVLSSESSSRIDCTSLRKMRANGLFTLRVLDIHSGVAEISIFLAYDVAVTG